MVTMWMREFLSTRCRLTQQKREEERGNGGSEEESNLRRKGRERERISPSFPLCMQAHAHKREGRGGDEEVGKIHAHACKRGGGD